MPIDKRLLEILVCPVTKVPVRPLSKDELGILNREVAQGGVHYVDGSAVQESLEEALITSDRKTVYRVDGGIPVMLEEQGIPAAQVPGW